MQQLYILVLALSFAWPGFADDAMQPLLILALADIETPKNKKPEKNISEKETPEPIFFEPFITGLVGSGGNLARQRYIINQIDKLDLMKYTRRQWIDWFTFQRNIEITIPGSSKNIVYIVAHYDKTDINPLKFFTLILNGFFDELAGFSYLTDGAMDNGTGVAVAVHLANKLNHSENYFTYRILLTGAEESGLRGARSHLAILSSEEKERIQFAINIDTVGLKNSENCLTLPISDSALALSVMGLAQDQGYVLQSGQMPSAASTDHAAFQQQNFLYDFGRGLKFNLVGGLLPQRSWFTSAHQAKVLNFSACEVIDVWDYVAGTVFLPMGKVHGPRDTLNKINYQRLYEQYRLIYLLLKLKEKEIAYKN